MKKSVPCNDWNALLICVIKDGALFIKMTEISSGDWLSRFMHCFDPI